MTSTPAPSRRPTPSPLAKTVQRSSMIVGICSYAAKPMPKGRRPTERMEANLEGALAAVGQAAASGADLVLLPEIVAVQNLPNWPKAAEPLDGPVLTAFAHEARKRRLWIGVGHVTLEEGRRYNSLVLLDREGKRRAVYHKTFPTLWEMERGITPGSGALTVDTEFGRIGFAICYDLNFAELRLQYRDARTDLILFSSFFRGGLQLRWWAYETRAHVAASIIGPEGGLVNPLGRWITRTDTIVRVAVAPAHLDAAVVHLDYTNVTLEAVRRKYGKEFAFESAEAEGVLLITALGQRRVDELLKEVGWERADHYFERARRAREEVLAGRRLPMGPPPFVD